MKYVYGKKMKTLRDRLTTSVAALALLANSVGMSLPFLLTQNAAAAAPESEVTSVDAYYSSGTGYTGIGIDFSTYKITDAIDIELRLLGGDDPDYSTHATNVLLTNLNASAADTYATTGTVVVTGSRMSSSGSWDDMTGTWAGSSRPTGAEVIVTLADGTKISKTDDTIVDNGGNTEVSVFSSVPEITSVDAYYTVGTGYTAISTDFRIKNIINATHVELRVNRTDSSTYSITAQQPVIDAINTTSPKSTTGPIVIAGSRTSGSWNNQTGTWTGDALPESVDVIITLANGDILTLRDDTIGTSKATWDQVKPVDTTDPTFSINTPANGSTVRGTVTVEAEITDESDITKVLMNIGGISRSWTNGSSTTITRSGNIFSTTIDTTTLPDGPIWVTLRGTDGAGNTRYWNNNAAHRQHVFYVDNTAPNITWQLQPKAIYGAGEGFHVRPITSEVGTTKSIYFDSVDPANLIRTLTSDHKNFDTSNAHNQVLWDGLAEGTHKFIAVFEDYAGNVTVSESKSFVIDRTNPTITVKGDYVGDKDAKTFSKVSFQLFDAQQVDKYVINGYVSDFTNNKWSDANFQNIKSRLVEGENTLVLFDVAGNSTTYTFIYDGTTPDAPVLSLETSAGIPIANGGVTNSLGVVASWSIGPDDASYQYRYFNSIPGDSYNEPHYYITQPTINSQSGVFNRGEGLHHIQVRAIDAAGNLSDWSNVFDVIYDATPPAVVLSIDSVFNPTQYTIGASDTNGLDVITAILRKTSAANGAEVTTACEKQMSAHGDIVFDIVCDLPTNLEDGEYNLRYNAKDAAGNQTISQQVNFTMDTTAPTAPTITAPGARTWHKTAPIVNSWTTATDDSGIDHYQIAYNYDDGHSFGGTNTCPGVTITGASGFIGCRDVNGLSRNHVPEAWEQGGVTIWVRAIDNAGNVGPWSRSVHYYYDHEAPTTDIDVSPVVNGVFTVSGDASDNLHLNRVYVQLVSRVANVRCGGATINLIPAGTTSGWSQTYDIATLMSVAATPVPCPEGEYAAHVAVVDMAGNTSSAGWTDNFLVANSPSLAADYFTVHPDSLGVGFSIDKFDDATSVEVSIYDAGDNLITKNVGDSVDMLNLINSHTGQISSPFYIPFGDTTDGYWTFGDADWTSVTPAYAVITINYGSGDNLSDSIDFTPVNPDTQDSFSGLVAGLNAGGSVGPEVKGAADCDGDGITDFNGCDNGQGSRALAINAILSGGQDGRVLGANDGLTNTGTQNGGLIVLVAAGLMALALVTLRRKQEN